MNARFLLYVALALVVEFLAGMIVLWELRYFLGWEP